MMKTLFIGTYLSRSRGTINPSEKIATEFSKSGIKVTLSSRYENKIARLFEIVWQSVFKNYDIIFIDVFSGPSFIIAEIASAIARYRGRRIILTLHGGMLPDFYQNNRNRVSRVLLKSKQILTPSRYLMHFFQGRGIIINYLPNSINLANFPFVTERSSEARLLWVRAFSKIYHPALAVETLYEVRKQFPSATLTMVGPDKGELKAIVDLIASLDLGSYVYITGPVPNDNLYKYYHSHSLFLNTTEYESFGVAVMEAAACGIPVVSTPAGEIPLLWENGIEILITDSWQSGDMAKGVLTLLLDFQKAELMREMARKKTLNFDWKLIKHKWIELLEYNDVN
jgi:glycosyltransferase involved in cell wall biosynthesis